MTPAAQAALLMKRYMHEYEVPADGFAGFALTAHANGVANKNAMFRKAIKAETYAKAEMVSDPLNMFDMAPNADGAAALLLTRRDLLPSSFKNPLVKIAGSGASSDTLALHDRKDMLYFDTAQLSAGKAMKQVGLRWMALTSSNITMRSASMRRCNSKRLGLRSREADGNSPRMVRLELKAKSPARRWAA
jgi:acetyl-CoA C-acetyltransferase